MLQRLDAAVASPGYSDLLRSQAARQAELVRRRLTDGDFLPGDRILLTVEGEQELSDTFAVEPGPALILPTVGSVTVWGVLRSELEAHLREAVGRFIRNPVVQAKPLLRITVLGAVNRPGFYTYPSVTLLTDVLDGAGGLTVDANLPKLHIDRGKLRLYEGDSLMAAIADGHTLDEMSIQAGDVIEVPRKRGQTGAESALRIVTLILAIPLSIYAVTRLF